MGFRTLLDALKGGAVRTPVRQTRRRSQRRLTVESLDDRSVPASLSISDVSILEGNAGTRNALLTVSLTGSNNPPVSVGYVTASGSAASGSDYQSVSGTLNFPKGVTSKSISIPIYGDTAVESNETFFVNLRNPKKATIADGQGVVTILNDDTRIYIGDLWLSEGNSGTTSFNFAVTLSNASDQPMTVNYATADGSAAAGSDYVAKSGTLTIPAGQTSGTVTVLVNGDWQSESDETFYVNLSNPTNGTIADGQGMGFIYDDEPHIYISDVYAAEGNFGTTTFDFTVTLSTASDIPVTVGFATADGSAVAGSDYVTASGTLTIPAGQTSGTVTVLLNGDHLSESDETFYVNLSNPTNGTIADGQGLGFIYDDEPHIYISDVSAPEGNSGTTTFDFTVTLSTESDVPVTVDFATADGMATSADGDYAADSGTLTFAPGETNQFIHVLVNGDSIVEHDEDFFVNLSNATNAQFDRNHGWGTILSDDNAVVHIDSWTDWEPDPYYGGMIPFYFTVWLSAPVSDTVTVDFSTADGSAIDGYDYLSTSGQLTFAPGATSQTITVWVLPDWEYEWEETFYVGLSNLSSNALFQPGWETAYGTIYDNQGEYWW
jgi:hypothetical protein